MPKKSKLDKISPSDNGLADFDDAELEDLYTWIDDFPLGRPKKNIARDFSDGLHVAAIISHVLPQIRLDRVGIVHPVNNTEEKRGRWKRLNEHVFSKLAFELDNQMIEGIINSKPGCIEKFLAVFRIKIDRALWELKRNPPQQKVGGRKTESDKPESDQYMGSPRGKAKNFQSDTQRGFISRHDEKGLDVEILKLQALIDRYYQEYLKEQEADRPEFTHRIPKKSVVKSVAEADHVPRILYEEKEQECLAKQETIKILEAKQQRLEHLVHLKDLRIEDLQSRLESMRPTGLKRM